MKQVLIIANPKAGKGKPLNELPGVQTHLQSLGYFSEIYYTQNTSDYEGIKNVIDKNKNYSGLIIIGGDGTLNDVINSITEDFKTPMIVLPCGSGNDFATYLYGKKTIPEILNGLLKNETIKINIGECNGQKFINGLGIGFDGWVAKKANSGAAWIPVVLKYNLAILRGLFTYKSFYTNLGQSLIIAIANGPTYGGGFRIAPQADPTDGLLDLWQIKPIAVIKRPYFLSLIKKGGHANIPGPYSHETLKEITIQCYKNLPAHLDGEYFEAEKFEVKILKSCAQFIK
ncbi:MAG: diacylglycerol/lipid kinase family protein [Bacteroidia bacterium]